MNYKDHLKAVDKKLGAAMGEEVFQLEAYSNIPLRLVHSIMSQQLSTKVAAVFRRRFHDLFPTDNPTAAEIQAVPYETLRSIGLSHAKATYVHHVAAFCIEHQLTDKRLRAMSNDEVIALLTQIKGVGRWTVEMLLMFSLGREDIFPVDDLGIRQAMLGIYKPRYKTNKELYEKLHRIAKKWSPYRTYACLHLWAWQDSPS